MFIDASAMVAVLTEEPEVHDLLARIHTADQCITSATAIWETTVRLVQKMEISRENADLAVANFMKECRVTLVPIGQAESVLAVEAWTQFGKGNHPARLNFSDCFAYACARAHGVELLYVGNDFSKTDVNGTGVAGLAGGEAG